MIELIVKFAQIIKFAWILVHVYTLHTFYVFFIIIFFFYFFKNFCIRTHQEVLNLI